MATKTSGGVAITGLKDVRRNLNRYGDGAKKEIKETHLEAARLVERTAKPKVPVVSGKLLSTVRSSGTQTNAVVRAGRSSVDYAPPVHWGAPRRGQRPNPFFYKALDSRRDEVVRLYERRVADLSRKYGF
jgi:hypothetical protein